MSVLQAKTLLGLTVEQSIDPGNAGDAVSMNMGRAGFPGMKLPTLGMLATGKTTY